MAHRPKRRVNAREVLRDVTGGMSDADLKRKYNLTDRGLQSLFRKLRQARGPAEGADTVYLRTPSEALGVRDESSPGSPSLPPDRKSEQRTSRQRWSCGSCGRKFGRMLKQCPVCGAIPTSGDRPDHSAHSVPSREPEQLERRPPNPNLSSPSAPARHSVTNLKTILGVSGSLLLLVGAYTAIVWFPEDDGLSWIALAAGAALLLSAAWMRARELASHSEEGDASGKGTRLGLDSCRPERSVSTSLARRQGRAKQREHL